MFNLSRFIFEIGGCYSNGQILRDGANMKLTRILILLAGITFLLAACNKEDEAVTDLSPADSNPLLAYVPADTAYVAADLESLPQGIIDAYLDRFQPVFDTLNEQVTEFKMAYATNQYEDEAAAKLASAVLDELNWDISVESFARLGLTPQAHHVMYGMGVFPVIRVELTDATALREAIARVEAKMGVSMPQSNFNGKTYWRISDEDSEEVGIYIAILDQQLAISVFPTSAEKDLLAAFMGDDMPAQSLASSNALGILNNAKGYTNYGSGFLDLQKMADEFLDPNSYTRTHLPSNEHYDTSSMDAVCVAEFKSIIAKAPRMTAGMTTITNNEMAVRYDLEMESTLATGLAALVSNTPIAEDGDHLFSASLAIQVGKLRNFLIEKANEIVSSPYQCEKLQHMNSSASSLVQQLNIPMPPMINNLMGFRVKVDDYDPEGGFGLTNGNGLLALYVDKPEMLVGMASMMLPGFEELDLANQKQPVRIPSSLTRVEGVDVYALMSKSAIGVALGDQDPAALTPFMKAAPQNSGTLFSMSIDMAKQMEIEQAITDEWTSQYADDFDDEDMDEDMDDDMDEHAAAFMAFSEAMQASYAGMLGRSRLDVNLNKDGVSIENRMTFK